MHHLPKLVFVVFCLTPLSRSASASEEPSLAATVAVDAPARDRFDWGIEVDTVYPSIPSVRAFTLNATRTLYRASPNIHGDLVAGIYLRPRVTDHDVVEELSEYLVNVGYRQYLYKGFNVELMLHTGFANGRDNKIDGKDYNNFALLGSAHAGYRFDVVSGKVAGFYVMPQVGWLAGISTNLGPRGDNPDQFFSARFNLGLAL